MSNSSPIAGGIPTLEEAREAAEACTACELYEAATQVVFGAGSAAASLMLLGEQPGDIEDREGEPFVGPAGRQLDLALGEAGIERSAVYVTNVVKHFRFEERGKKRLHKKPARRHVEACRPWLDVEIRQVDPAVVVCLGGSAAEAILGHDVRVMSDRGNPVEWNDRLVLPTIHPSYVIRSRDDDVRRQRFGLLVEDLAAAAALAQR
jgi:uracil-DNA glycosylase family protein